MNRKIVITAAVVIAALAAIYFFRAGIAERRFKGKADQLAEKIPEKYREAYEEEFYYNINKFWSAYENGLVSKNDLIDVTDYMNDLNRKEELSRKEVFDFMSYVSRIYTEEIKKRHEEEYRNGPG